MLLLNWHGRRDHGHRLPAGVLGGSGEDLQLLVRHGLYLAQHVVRPPLLLHTRIGVMNGNVDIFIPEALAVLFVQPNVQSLKPEQTKSNW